MPDTVNDGHEPEVVGLDIDLDPRCGVCPLGGSRAVRTIDDVPQTSARTIGVPRETRIREHRVALSPDGVRELERLGTTVRVEAGAGLGAGFTDDDYRAAGADIVPAAEDAWAQQIVVKVKEPSAHECQFLRPDLTLVAYLHLAAHPALTRSLLDSGCTALALETMETSDGAMPLLAPMSEIAGRLAPQIGAHFLERHQGGRGVLLGGAAGVPSARVVVLGAGTVGWNAARIAVGMQADVVLLDRNIDRLRWADQASGGQITTMAANQGALERVIASADLLIGAVLVSGGRAPTLVTDAMVRSMKRGAVVVDVAIDQGGCIETITETSHDDPVRVVHDIVHYGVSNIPGSVPHTSTTAFTNAAVPFQRAVALHGAAGAAREDSTLASGFNVVAGHLTNSALAATFDAEYVPPLVALGITVPV